ncbi:MAG: hypothetical protein R6U70_07355 [Bacillota bacterium]
MPVSTSILRTLKQAADDMRRLSEQLARAAVQMRSAVMVLRLQDGEDRRRISSPHLDEGSGD